MRLFILAFLSFTIAFIPSCFAAQECVVLLHGYGRSSKSMRSIESLLVSHNYKVINIDYPSRQFNLTDITHKKVKPLIVECLNKEEKIHFVGYSMGGVITKHFIETHQVPNLGNVVFIASPIKGSDISAKLSKNSFFRLIFGPAAADLSTESDFVKSLKEEIFYPLGIITASISHNPLTSLFLLPGPNDGTVTLASTRIKGIADHIIINANHNSIINLEETHKQVLSFLKNRSFKK
ncbi:MAG: alpha/beta fold hydrolase [Rickettsiaceae bacterium]|jgi:pimeloyl-ACP methyl ester carboxylesterase|nr:alpha/beta fold hydrolase [Rickettsiaceae bacterium]